MAEALEPPVEPTPETPAAADTPVEAAADTPVDTPVEAAADTPADTPVEAAADTPPLETLPATLTESAATETVVPLLLREEKTYPRRFRSAVFVLGIVLGAAIAGFVLLATHHDKKPAPFAVQLAGGGSAFGGWHPTCTTEFGCDRPHQIAAYVAPKYQLPDGKDVVAIISGRPTVPNADGTSADVPIVIERNDHGSRIVYTATDQDNTVQYALCGFGANCTIGGTPSVERGDLLRRQALELALLTFRYDTAVKSVLTFFPKAAKATGPSFALFFRRQDYDLQLSRPLAATLGKQLVVKVGQLSESLARDIGKLTTPRVFKYEYRQTQQGFPILVLTPAAY